MIEPTGPVCRSLLSISHRAWSGVNALITKCCGLGWWGLEGGKGEKGSPSPGLSLTYDRWQQPWKRSSHSARYMALTTIKMLWIPGGFKNCTPSVKRKLPFHHHHHHHTHTHTSTPWHPRMARMWVGPRHTHTHRSLKSTGRAQSHVSVPFIGVAYTVS